MGVIDVYFVDSVAKKIADEKQPIIHTPRVHQLFSLSPFSTSFRPFLSTSFYRVRDSAPDGSSPQGYSQKIWV
jgi:hypothetical protein